jgi:hypothetical protein
LRERANANFLAREGRHAPGGAEAKREKPAFVSAPALKTPKADERATIRATS